MIVFVGGIPKSGSNWVRNMVNEIIIESGGESVVEFRKKERVLDNILVKNVNRIGSFSLKKTLYLGYLSIFKKDFYVYYMSEPNLWLKFLLKFNLAKFVFTHRDPRDVVSSLLKHNNHVKEHKKMKHHFYKIDNIKEATVYTEKVMRQRKDFLSYPNVFCLSYNSSRNNCLVNVQDVSKFLGYDLDRNVLGKICDKFDRDLSIQNSNVKHLHIYSSKSSDFTKDFSVTELNQLTIDLSEIILEYGY